MSNQHLKAIWESGRYAGSCLIVLIYLADRANESGECWPSATKICKATRLDRTTLFRGLNRLSRDGIVERFHGPKKSNLYRINTTHLTDGGMPPVAIPHHTGRPAPLTAVGSDHQNSGDMPPELPKKPQKATVKLQTIVDPRHAKAKAVIHQRCEVNKVPFTWDITEDRVMARWLKATPGLGAEDITKLIHNRFKSDGIPLGERPRCWIENLGRYAEGPLDRYGRLKDTNSEATVGMSR